jgi:site-specific DNA-methyltransferase (adenine-specific)
MTQSTSLGRKLHTNGTQNKLAVTIPLHDYPQCRALRLDAITLDEQLCSRADGLRQDVIDEYREGLQRGDIFPAVTVFFDGTQYYLVDGFHRYYAYRLEHIETIEAEIHEGNLRDARLLSAATNLKHGLRRTNSDKGRAVKILLEDAEWRTWSDNAIAAHCGVDHKTVAKYRLLALASLGNSQVNPVRKYRNKHAGLGTMQTGNIGGRHGQRPEPIFHTSHVFDHVRQLLQSYQVSYPGLEVVYETQQNALTIRVTPSKPTASQGAVEDVAPSLEPFLNQILQGEYLDTLATLPANSLPMIITDLPYVDALSDTSDDDSAYLSYLGWMRECLIHLYRIGTPECRLCLNVQADVGNNGIMHSLYSDILQLAKQVGFQYRSEITWYQPVYRRSTLGKGSASAPHLVNPVERVMILYKHQWERLGKGVSPSGSASPHLAHGLWQIDVEEIPGTAQHRVHFPLQVPVNLLQLLSDKDDVVLDPFGGAGSVAVAAKQLGRKFILIAQDAQGGDLVRERLLREVYLT